MSTQLSPLFSSFAQQAAPAFSPWVLAVIFILLVVLFVWLLLRWQSRKAERVSARPFENQPVERQRVSVKAPQPVVTERPAVPAAAPVPEPVLTAPVTAMDDLEIIEGIGPKIAGVLKQAGITTFAQLAEMQPERISEILRAGGIRLADTRSWPQQARLAAGGDMVALKALQDRLQAGREA